MRRIGPAAAAALACVLAAAATAAEPESIEATTGLSRPQISQLVSCVGEGTSQLSLAVGLLTGDTPEQTRARADATNQKLPEQHRKTPEAIAGIVAELHAPPRKRLHEYGAARAAACAREAEIPLDGALVARCYSLVSFVNGMLFTGLGGDNAEIFSAHWAPELARTPAELPALQRALAARYGRGPSEPRQEVLEYLACTTRPEMKNAPLIAPLPAVPAE